jgi:phosphoserine/homoserine phosphotransferase
MRLVCLDLEGVLIPEIWIAFSETTGISDFRRTTRDEPDYDALMRFRIDLLARHGLRLGDITRVISIIEPLAGAVQFVRSLRAQTQLIILSDTYEQFAAPLMEKLDYPTIFCNRLVVDPAGTITGYTLRQRDGKKAAVAAFKSLNIEVFAAGDSFNDLAMLYEADTGCLFRAPPAIRETQRDLPCVDTYSDLLGMIETFLYPPSLTVS